MRLYIRFFWGVDDIEIAKKLLDLLPDDFDGAPLDIPCGTINLTAGKYAKLKNACITCLDYSEDMQEILFYEIDLSDIIDAAHPSLLIS